MPVPGTALLSHRRWKLEDKYVGRPHYSDRIHHEPVKSVKKVQERGMFQEGRKTMEKMDEMKKKNRGKTKDKYKSNLPKYRIPERELKH